MRCDGARACSYAGYSTKAWVSCKTWCSEESTHDCGLRDSVATRGIEWEGVLVGALDCAVANTHFVLVVLSRVFR